MFNPNRIVTDAFIRHLDEAFETLYPGVERELSAALKQAARTALDTLVNCDCPYHDVEHTMLVTDAGLCILRGRQLRHGDLNARTWLQAVVAMLFHDVGYLRGLLKDDRNGSYVVDTAGRRITPPVQTSDAWMTPYHVTRGRLFVLERFRHDTVIDAHKVADLIEMTRFPIPKEVHYQETDSLGALVRAADLIGQMGDPAYPAKQARLFAEFQETGEARKLQYQSAADLRSGFPSFFYQQVYPYIIKALEYLALTREGRQWTANLLHHVHGGNTLPADQEPGWIADPMEVVTEPTGRLAERPEAVVGKPQIAAGKQ